MADEQKYYSTETGQISIFSPRTAQKTRGALVDELMSREITEQIAEFTVSDRAIPEPSVPVETRVLLSYEGVEVDGRVQLDDIDREVIDAVATLAMYNEYITSQMVYRVIAGKRKGEYLSPAQRKLVVDSMNKCAYSKLTIRLPEVLVETQDGRKYPTETTFHGNLLSFEVITAKNAMGTTDYYKILAKPALFRYAQSIGRISEFPLEMLDTPPAKTRSIIMVQAYLLRRIDAMNRKEAPIEPILWKDVRAHGAWNNESRAQNARIRKLVGEILDHWRSHKFILGYKADNVMAGGILISPNHGFQSQALL